MLSAVTLNLPFPPTGAAQALVSVTAAGAVVLSLHPAGTGAVPLGPYPSGAVLTTELRWFGADGAQIGPPVADTLTLPAGGDSTLTYTIATEPSPVPPVVESPVVATQ